MLFTQTIEYVHDLVLEVFPVKVSFTADDILTETFWNATVKDIICNLTDAERVSMFFDLNSLFFPRIRENLTFIHFLTQRSCNNFLCGNKKRKITLLEFMCLEIYLYINKIYEKKVKIKQLIISCFLKPELSEYNKMLSKYSALILVQQNHYNMISPSYFFIN